MISDLENLDTYGSYPEAVDEHHWVKLFREIKAEKYNILYITKILPQYILVEAKI